MLCVVSTHVTRCHHREIGFLSSGTLATVGAYNSCVCPHQAPAISATNSNICVSNADVDRDLRTVGEDEGVTWGRFSGGDFYPPENAADLDFSTAWVSTTDHLPISLKIIFPERVQVMGLELVMDNFPSSSSRMLLLWSLQITKKT